MRTLVYADRELAIAIAARLVGLQLQEKTVSGAFNWLLQAKITHEQGWSVVRDIRELLPEDIIYEIDEYLSPEVKFESVEECVRQLESGHELLMPGRPLSIRGFLSFPDLAPLERADPANPPDIEMKIRRFHAEECFIGELGQGGYRMPVYFSKDSQAEVCFCHRWEVEITGIVRWAPAFQTGRANALNRAIRAAALWLQ